MWLPKVTHLYNLHLDAIEVKPYRFWMASPRFVNYCNSYRLIAHPSVFMADFNSWLGLKVNTRLAVIVRLSPVCGFLPVLSFFSLTMKFPNPLIFRFSPLSSVSFIISSTLSTYSKACFFGISSLVEILSTKAFFVSGFRTWNRSDWLNINSSPVSIWTVKLSVMTGKVNIYTHCFRKAVKSAS